MNSTATTEDILEAFEKYVDDNSELSSDDELILAQKIYDMICDDRPWEFLKKPATGTAVISNGVCSISAPADFKYFVENNQSTFNNDSVENNAAPKVIYLSTATNKFTSYQVINFSDRRVYVNQIGYVYFDARLKQIIFTGVPTDSDLSYEFDYIMQPPDLNLDGSNPVFPQRYWDAIYHGMAVDDMIIQLFDRAHSYQNENSAMYKQIMAQMAYWNSSLIVN